MGKWERDSEGNLTEITIPEGVTEIPEQSFMGCSKLTRVELPDSLRSIGEDAFASCA